MGFKNIKQGQEYERARIEFREANLNCPHTEEEQKDKIFNPLGIVTSSGNPYPCCIRLETAYEKFQKLKKLRS